MGIIYGPMRAFWGGWKNTKLTQLGDFCELASYYSRYEQGGCSHCYLLGRVGILVAFLRGYKLRVVLLSSLP